MLFPTAIYFFYLLFSLSFYWTLRLIFPNKKFEFIALFLINIVFLLIASPYILLFIFLEFFIIFFLYKLIKIFGLTTSYCWVAVFPLFLLSGPLLNNSVYSISLEFFTNLTFQNTPTLIGGTFIVLKSFIILKYWLKRNEINLIESLVTLTFIPSFPAGPIHGSKEWGEDMIKKNLSQNKFLSLKNILIAFCRIFWGISSLMIISSYVSSFIPSYSPNDFSIFYGSYIRFIALFFDFSGYSSIAIGSAMLFGVVLPENFNKPFLATNIQEYWQRWHISMSGFIGTYIYKSYLRATNNRKLGVFISFVFAGLWHKISIPFLIWGIGHGSFMAFAPKFNLEIISNSFLKKALGWFITFNIVSILSSLSTGYIRFN
tara:strand:- start:2234 stop:3352 length:1119 start_codon:yes stop_codon:yes gene_type:complete